MTSYRVDSFEVHNFSEALSRVNAMILQGHKLEKDQDQQTIQRLEKTLYEKETELGALRDEVRDFRENYIRHDVSVMKRNIDALSNKQKTEDLLQKTIENLRSDNRKLKQKLESIEKKLINEKRIEKETLEDNTSNIMTEDSVVEFAKMRSPDNESENKTSVTETNDENMACSTETLTTEKKRKRPTKKTEKKTNKKEKVDVPTKEEEQV